MARTALIVGAGIGGLSAGIALRRAGWRVRIFEQASSPRELGFGLSLAPNAIAALRDLGVAATVLEKSYTPRRGEVRRPDGTVLKRAELPPDMLGGPMVVALRPALHGALLDAVGSEAIALEKKAVGCWTGGAGVSLKMADGEVVEGDLLVGADGVHSVVRHALHPDEPPPRPSGIVAVRGVVHGVVAELGDLSSIFYTGRGIESVFVRASETGIYWFLSLARAWVPSELREPSAVLKLLAPSFDATFRAITTATTDLRLDDLVDRDPLSSWGRGAVTLLGDAAHPMLPHTGQGAAQAMVDAVSLAKALAGERDIERALRGYERERLPATSALLQQGRRTASIMRTMNPAACLARELVIRAIPVKALARFYARVNRRAGTDTR